RCQHSSTHIRTLCLFALGVGAHSAQSSLSIYCRTALQLALLGSPGKQQRYVSAQHRDCGHPMVTALGPRKPRCRVWSWTQHQSTAMSPPCHRHVTAMSPPCHRHVTAMSPRPGSEPGPRPMASSTPEMHCC
uniref:Uncharacterized protein n=1 Tax=Coturnix japonica TaxID=93934 RepID=A0A8C2TL46_COTJA